MCFNSHSLLEHSKSSSKKNSNKEEDDDPFEAFMRDIEVDNVIC